MGRSLVSQVNISRVAKILARATSPEPNEAHVALHSAYKRMQRDHVEIHHLLTLPLADLYQETLVKLVILILEKQDNLSPSDRRKSFENSMSLITHRFSRSDFDQHHKTPSAKTKEDHFQQQHEDNTRCEAEKQRQEEARQREEKFRQEQEDTTRHQTEKRQQAKSHPHSGNEPRSSRASSRSKIFKPLLKFIASVVFLVALVALSRDKEFMKAVASTSKSLPLMLGSVAKTPGESASRPTQPVSASSQDSATSDVHSNQQTHTAAQHYINRRSQENRVDALMNKIDTKVYKNTFNLVLYDLLSNSKSIHKSLMKLQAEKRFYIKPDAPASAQFSLSTNLAMRSNNYEQAFWEARAAIEADPMDPEHHVAFSLANYHLKNYETMKSAGMLIPKIAPTSSNAWMLFALGNSLTPGSNDQMTTSAFVLSIKLSKNPNNTRQYYREFADNTPQPRIRDLLTAALQQEAQHPKLFSEASRLH